MARQSTKRKGPKKAQPFVESPKIIVVDDDPGVLRLLTRLLQKKYEVTAFSSAKEALKYLRAEQVDVIISDYMMAGMDGIQFIQKTLELAPDAKRIITTGFYDVETVVASINEAQIDFFLTKPLNSDGLYQAVDKMWSNRLLQKERDLLAAQNHEMVKELKAFNKKLEGTVKERTTSLTGTNRKLKKALQEIENKNRALTLLNESLNVLATVDPLTSLYNRREFLIRLSLEWDRYQRHKRPFALIMADIDHFKLVNDTYGHECGDSVLRDIADLMRKQKRRNDVVCRYGGEEFMLLLPETRLKPAFKVAESLRNLVAEFDFRCKKHRLHVRISLGLAGMEEHNPESETDLVLIADQGLYRAKNEGRDRTIVIEKINSRKIKLKGGG